MPIAPLTGLTPLPSPSAGLTSPGGFRLNQIFQAMQQAPSILQKQQELQLQKQQMATRRLALLTSIIDSNPNAANDPRMQQQLLGAYRGLGINPPMKNGKLDTSSLTDQFIRAQIAKNPRMITDIEAQPSGSPGRQSIFNTYMGTTDVPMPDYVENLPHTPKVTAAEAFAISDGLVNDVQTARKTPEAAISIAAQFAQEGKLAVENTTFQQLVSEIMTASKHLSPVAEASLERLRGQTKEEAARVKNLDAATKHIMSETDESKALSDYYRLRNEWLPKIDSAKVENLNASTAQHYASAAHLAQATAKIVAGMATKTGMKGMTANEIITQYNKARSGRIATATEIAKYNTSIANLASQKGVDGTYTPEQQAELTSLQNGLKILSNAERSYNSSEYTLGKLKDIAIKHAANPASPTAPAPLNPQQSVFKTAPHNKNPVLVQKIEALRKMDPNSGDALAGLSQLVINGQHVVRISDSPIQHEYIVTLSNGNHVVVMP